MRAHTCSTHAHVSGGDMLRQSKATPATKWFLQPAIRTNWMSMLGSRVYDPTRRKRLDVVGPELYFSMRDSLVRLAERKTPLSTVEYPFVVDNTHSNDLVLMDLTYAYALARGACADLAFDSLDKDRSAQVRMIRGIISFIQQSVWRRTQEQTFLPPFLQDSHLEPLAARLRALFVCAFVRGRFAAKIQIQSAEGPTKLLTCMLVLTDKEIDECGQRPYVNTLISMWLIRAYQENPSNTELARCFQCYADKASGFQRTMAFEEDVLSTTFPGGALPRHTQGPHVEIRSQLKASSEMERIAEQSVAPFDPSQASELMRQADSPWATLSSGALEVLTIVVD